MEQKRSGKLTEAVRVFLFFFRIGFYTFGGGWSIVAQIQKEYVEKRQCITNEDLLDITSVGRSVPGIMICNVSYLFGYRMAGFPGAVAGLIGISLPSLIVLTLVTWGYAFLQGNLYVERAMAGVRASVAPIILLASAKLRTAALADKSGLAFMVLAAVAYVVLGWNCAVVVCLCAVLGLALSALRRYREERRS